MKSNICFLAFEPWETQLAARFLESVPGNDLFSHLVVTDPYQIRNVRSAERLERIRSSESFSTNIVFEDLLDWQADIQEPNSVWAQDVLDNFDRRFGDGKSELAIRSDVYLNPLERSPYYPPLKANQRKMAAALIINRCIEIYDSIEPTEILMIEDQYLPKFVFGLIAENMNVPVRVFRHSRFQDFVICNDFFFAPQNTKKLTRISEEARKPSLENHLYEGNKASSDKPFLVEAKVDKMHSTLKVFKRLIRDQKRKLRNGNGTRPREWKKALYLVSTSWRVHVYALLGSIRTLRYIWISYPFKPHPAVPENFVLVPLHYRPESGVMTQGNGLTDEDLIALVADACNAVDQSLACVVLENPSMIPDRRLKFYRKALHKRRNVVFADPAINTLELAIESRGVVTISGTLGLEASLLGKPVHVLGRPEYLPAIQSRGVAGLEAFLDGLVKGNPNHSRDSVAAYLEWVSVHGIRGTLGWPSVESDSKKKRAVEMLLKLYAKSRKTRTG